MKSLTRLIIGVIILLIICLWTFEGTMIPAMWELLSMIWIGIYIYFFGIGE